MKKHFTTFNKNQAGNQSRHKTNIMFTQKCFIRKNTPELVQKLEDIGYKALFSARNGYGEYLYAFNGTIVGGEYNAYNEKTGFVDCGTNEELFLAIAALRDDSDRFQWFVDPCGYWHFNPILLDGLRKATVKELIEHFKP